MGNKEVGSLRSIGILTIATKRYLEYAIEMIHSLDDEYSLDSDCVVHLFTDQLEKARKIKTKKVKLEIHPIESYGWPEATLLRFKIFKAHQSFLKQDILIYLDADMKFVSEFGNQLKPEKWEGGLALVSHPGFWRPTGISRVKFYLSNITQLLKDFIRWITIGGLGTWETNKESAAYTPRSLRRNYVCGGTWMGHQREFIDMVSQLDESVERDLKGNVMAKWHDESHLNAWASLFPHELLPPSYCYDSDYPWLNEIEPIIKAVTKTNLEQLR